jgi:hypothetical protein
MAQLLPLIDCKQPVPDRTLPCQGFFQGRKRRKKNGQKTKRKKKGPGAWTRYWLDAAPSLASSSLAPHTLRATAAVMQH